MRSENGRVRRNHKIYEIFGISKKIKMDIDTRQSIWSILYKVESVAESQGWNADEISFIQSNLIRLDKKDFKEFLKKFIEGEII